jgi:hypothetical protein
LLLHLRQDWLHGMSDLLLKNLTKVRATPGLLSLFSPLSFRSPLLTPLGLLRLTLLALLLLALVVLGLRLALLALPRLALLSLVLLALPMVALRPAVAFLMLALRLFVLAGLLLCLLLLGRHAVLLSWIAVVNASASRRRVLP